MGFSFKPFRISKSLQVRVVFNVFTTSLLLLLLFGSLIFFQLTAMTKSIAKERLLEQARKIASYIEYDWKGAFDLDLPRRYRDYYSDMTDTHQYAVLDSQGEILYQSKNFMVERIIPTLKQSGMYYFKFQTDDGKYFTGLKYDYLFDGRIYPIYVIEYEVEFSRFIATLEHNFLNNIITFGSPLLLLQCLLIILIFRNALQPVLRASRDARNIKYDNLSFRLDEKNVDTELLPLIKSVNNGLSRLEKSAEAQKFFIANAAHELRTPISILKARIASLKDEKEIYMLNNDLRNINRLISQMLDISRLDLAEAAPRTKVNLNTLAKKACEDMGALFVSHEKELSLEQRKTDQVIDGNEDTLFRAILNLLENALKHTPPKTPVKVIVDEKTIIVRDYGNPIPDAYKMKIFEKFEKAPESLNTKGSGLGLAIVKKAADIHGGTVSIVTRSNGNDFVLDFK